MLSPFQIQCIELLKEQNKPTRNFSDDPEVDTLLNRLDELPHVFVLGCLMQQQANSVKAWRIPYIIGSLAGDFSFSRWLQFTQQDLEQIFIEHRLHRFKRRMARFFYLGIQRIHAQYQDDAANIWRGNPASAVIVQRFLEFDGVGIKIATMATNMLARDFGMPMADYAGIDISPDVQVGRVFERLGLVPSRYALDKVVQAARELNPDYPGVLDLPVWQVGWYWCKADKPICSECYLNSCCPKVGVSEHL